MKHGMNQMPNNTKTSGLEWQEAFALYEPCYLPATIAEGLNPELLERRWRPRDDRGRFTQYTRGKNYKETLDAE